VHLLTPAEVAALFRVDPKTIAGWERSGRLAAVRTPGGHRRYPLTVIEEVLGNTPGNAASWLMPVIDAIKAQAAAASRTPCTGHPPHEACEPCHWVGLYETIPGNLRQAARIKALT
jgi:excisionase family DNA binding protein